MRSIRIVAQLVLALVLGVLLLFPLGWLFGVMGWPMYHIWGLMHGAFFSAIPVMVIASFSVLGEIPWFRHVHDPYRRVIALAVGMVITAWFVPVHSSGDSSYLSIGALTLVGLAFVASAALCYKADRPLLIALMIPLPLLFHDSQFFLMPWDSLLGYIGYGMLRTTVPVAVLAFLGALVTRAWPKRAHA